MIEDNYGTLWGFQNNSTPHPEHAVYDIDVYLALNGGAKTAFAFINTCYSASISDYVGNYYAAQRWETSQQWPYHQIPVGMPLSWTGRLVKNIDSTPGFNLAEDISDNGYGNPDAGAQVYIGFPIGSASLQQNLPTNGIGQYPYYDWVYCFFWYALNNDISVNQALNSASDAIYGQSFGDCPLQTGFTPYWWGFSGDWPTSTMAVYGNGNIHLKNYAPPSDSVALRTFNCPSTGDVSQSKQFTVSGADSKDHTIQYTFDWGDGTQTQTGWLANYQTANVSHSWSSAGIYSVTVRAQCSNGQYSSWSNPISINIGNVPVYHSVTIDAYDAYLGYGYPLQTNVYVDGSLVGTTPQSMQMLTGTDHSLTVDFNIYDPYWPSEVHAVGVGGSYNGYYDLYSDSLTVYFHVSSDSTIEVYYTQWW